MSPTEFTPEKNERPLDNASHTPSAPEPDRLRDGRLALLDIERALVDSGRLDILREITAEIARSTNVRDLWTRVGLYLKRLKSAALPEIVLLQQSIDIFLEACRDRGIGVNQ